MGSRTAAAELGRRNAGQLRARVAADIRAARREHGLSQRSAARAAGISPSQLGRIERSEIVGLTLDQTCRAAAAVGLRWSLTSYPDGDPARDAGQLRLLGRLRSLVPTAISVATEVPMPLPGDRRAWDALLRSGERRAGCECESKLLDVQALERRLALKLRDGGVDVLILVVADTATNRAMLAAHREELRGLLPLDTRAVMRSLRAGRLPAANGIIVL